MATPTLYDQAVLQQLFQEPLSPIANYGQGMMGLAMERRRRDQAMQDFQMKQAAELEQQRQLSALETKRQEQIEGIRQRGEMERAQLANKRFMDQLKLEYELKNKEEKESERVKMVRLANEYGAKLPTNTDYETAAQAFVDQHGQAYISANKRLGTALSGVLRHTGLDSKELSTRIANMVADDPAVAKQLTIQEREEIRRNPDKIMDIRSRFISKKAKYEAVSQAMTQASSVVTADLEKAAASRPEAVVAAADLKQATDAVQRIGKMGGFSPEVEDAAFRAYQEAAKPAPPPAPPGRPDRASILRGLTTPPATAPSAPALPPLGMGTQRNVPGAMLSQISPQVAAASPFRNVPLSQTMPWSISRPENFELAQPQVDPNILATLRLRKFLQDSAATNNSLFPTAFPTTSPTAEGANPGFGIFNPVSP